MRFLGSGPLEARRTRGSVVLAFSGGCAAKFTGMDHDDEHNSSYVPWHAMCREILPGSGRRVDYRPVRPGPGAGEPDLDPPDVADRRAYQTGLLHRRRITSTPATR